MANNDNQYRMVEAHALIQKGEEAKAIAKLQVLIKQLPNNADVNHLMALAHKGLGRIEDAVAFFIRSLDLNKRQPQVYNNLANLQKTNQDFEAAEKNYQIAISMNASYIEAYRNLAMCYSAQEKFQSVVDVCTQCLKIKADDVENLVLLANGYRQLSEFAYAEQYYRAALQIEPNHLSAWHNLGINHHLQHQRRKAQDCYARAYQLAPNTPAVVQSFALISNELGLSQVAAQAFESYLEGHPDDISMHERFNDMLWETELKHDFGLSYQQAIKKLPESKELRVSYLYNLFKAGDTARAADELHKAVKVLGRAPELLSLKGQILAEQQQYELAAKALLDSLIIEYSQTAAQQLVKLYILLEKYALAQEQLNQLMKRFPDCQLNWAYQSLIWRLVSDERYFWLTNYQQFVRPFRLETPSGYSSLDEFLQSLDQILGDLHLMQNAPLQQTLRNGTQTSARLLHNPIRELALLKQALGVAVADYIQSLPDDLNHPFLKRKSQQFEFAGSWSVKLKADGFHVNHVHPHGWISSSCYITIPQSMSVVADGLQRSEALPGSIKFGESPLQLGDREVIEKVVQPVPGMVVLFPSYCWHGTIPFSGDKNDYRMTAPFDIIPL